MFNAAFQIGIYIDICWRFLKPFAPLVYLIVTFDNFEIPELQV